jgi:hypothetical protein
MISKQKQIGQLRRAILSSMRDYRFRRSLMNVATNNRNVATGKFLKLLRNAKDDAFSINASFSKDGLMEDVRLSFDLRKLLGDEYFYYFQTLDYEVSANRNWKMNPGGYTIERWIENKIINGTWVGSTLVPYTRNYKGRESRTVFIDLNKRKDRLRMAFAISKSIKQNNDIVSKSDYSGVIRQALSEILEYAFDDFLNEVGINIYNEAEILLNEAF